MEAKDRTLYTKIIEQSYRQYTIPVYQRVYTWQKDNCKQLYDDILESIRLDKKHYLGSLVYSEKEENDFSICQVIDGQQRLTTVILMLKALYDLMDDDENKDSKTRIYSALYNDSREERYKLKIKSIDGDNSQLEKILSNDFDTLDMMSNVVINYYYFKERITESLNEGITLKQIFDGIKNLEIVEIVLNEKDEPQAIFESINSTGVRLSTADLIRNFLLMGIKDPGIQKEKYNTYWLGMETRIGKDNVEKFFYDFLVMKDTRFIEESKVYENFKKYYRELNDKELVFKEIIEYAEYYKLIVSNNSSKYSNKSNEICKIFGLLRHNTIYPFLLKVCKDYSDIQKLYGNEYLDENERNILLVKNIEFNNILSLLANYAIRRLVAEIPSSSLRRFYATLYNKVFLKNKVNKQKYYKSIETYLCSIKTDDKFPTDDQFKDALKYNNIYKKPRILKHFFDLIENGDKKKEIVVLDDLTIEHILPETMNNKWKDALGENYQEIYDRYVHTLGNLSITGYNSEYSNDTYVEKKNKYLNYFNAGATKIKVLNKEYFDESNTWGEKEILKRAERLSDTIINKYPYPKDIDNSIEFEKYIEYYLDSDEDNAEYGDNPNYKIYGFEFKGEKYQEKYYKDIYLHMLKLIYEISPSGIEEAANNKLTFESGVRILFSKERENERQCEILPGIFVEFGFSRYTIFWLIKNFIKKAQIDLDEFCILYVEKEN